MCRALLFTVIAEVVPARYVSCLVSELYLKNTYIIIRKWQTNLIFVWII